MTIELATRSESRPLLIRNLAQVATPLGVGPVRGLAMRELRVREKAVIVIAGGRFSYVGLEADLPPALRKSIQSDFDADGKTAVPGFVDTHTHIPFAGYRESEFNRRLHGESYEVIAASGGGIASTVRATRASSEEDLTKLVLERCRTMSLHGTTTAEAKSGYGLNLVDEVKQLRALSRAKERSPVVLLPTCLAAHELPPEGGRSEAERNEYVDRVIDEILPAVAAGNLAEFCDVFVERGVFTVEDGERVLLAGIDAGMRPRIHADEFSDSGGAALGARLGALSADHLMHISDGGISALASSETVANLLPGTSFFLMSDRFAPARSLLDAGAIVSLSTDCNPGSSMTESMQIVMQLASLRMKLTVEETLTAATLNGAYGLRRSSEIGSIEVGKIADLVLLECPNYLHLVYHFGVNLVRDVFSRGELVVRDGRAVEAVV